MNAQERIRKSLADIKLGEKGWQRVLATAEGSFSQRLAEKNLSRLEALRQTLLHELDKIDSHL